MTPRAVAGGLLATAIVLTVLFMPTTTLTTRSEDGSIDLCRSIRHGASVDLVFTNSMYGGDVRESFVVADDALRRVGFATELVAAAEYYAWNVAIEKTDAGYQVVVPEVLFSSIPVLVDKVGAHRLEVAGESIALSERIDAPVSVVIDVAASSLATRLLGGC